MCEQSLLAKRELIEGKKKELHFLYQEDGKITKRVLEKSQELDDLIFQYQKEILQQTKIKH